MNDKEREQMLDAAAELLDQELTEKVEQLELIRDLIPEELDMRQYAEVMEIEAARKAEQSRIRRKRMLQTAAAILLCTTLTVGTTMGVSEGFRKRVFQVFNYEQEGAVALRADEEELIGNWSGYWYPTYLPEGYKLIEADELDHFLLFQNNEGESIRMFEETSDLTATFDSETMESSKIKVGVHDGYLFWGDADESVDAIVMTDARTLFLHFEGIHDNNEIEKILESLEYEK